MATTTLAPPSRSWNRGLARRSGTLAAAASAPSRASRPAVRAASAAPRPAARPTSDPRPAAHTATDVSRPTARTVSVGSRPAVRRTTAATPVAYVDPRSASPATGHGVRPALVLERPHVASGVRPLRLTRRGRRLARTVVILLAVVATLVLSMAGRAATSQAGDGVAVPATTTVVVQPGETLWTVARGLSADADVRETIARIQELNGLSGTAASTVRPGQQLIVPLVR